MTPQLATNSMRMIQIIILVKLNSHLANSTGYLSLVKYRSNFVYLHFYPFTFYSLSFGIQCSCSGWENLNFLHRIRESYKYVQVGLESFSHSPPYSVRIKFCYHFVVKSKFRQNTLNPFLFDILFVVLWALNQTQIPFDEQSFSLSMSCCPLVLIIYIELFTVCA